MVVRVNRLFDPSYLKKQTNQPQPESMRVIEFNTNLLARGGR
jgi:hypothetical protein